MGTASRRRFTGDTIYPPALTAELKRKTERREICTITTNLLKLLESVVTAWVMLELTGDRPMSVGDPIAMRGDNVSGVTWVNKCDGAKDRRACLLMRMLGRLEIKDEWSHVAKHITGFRNTLSGWHIALTQSRPGRKNRQVTDSNDWVEQDIGRLGLKIFDVVLGTKNASNRHDDRLWDIMVNGRDSV